MNARSRRRLAAFVVGAAILVPACGSHAKTATAAKSTATTAAGTSSPADNSLSPIVVGVDSLESSTASQKEARIGFEQGVKYVTAELGGINGHPLKAEVCKVDTSPASSVNCANQWVQDKVVADVPVINPNAPSALPILERAGIPIVVYGSRAAQLNTATGEVFSMLPSSYEYYVDFIVAMQKEGIKKATLVAPLDVPGTQAYVDLAQKVADKLGISITVVGLPSTVTDYTAFAATVLASSPKGVIIPSAADTACDGLLPAIRNNGFTGPVFLAACTHFGSILPPSQVNNTFAAVVTWNPAIGHAIPANVRPDTDIYLKYMGMQSELKPAEYNIAFFGFFTAVTMAEMLRQVPGEITAASFKHALPTTKGRIFMNGLPFDCNGTGWPGTTSCAKGVTVLKWGPDGKAAVTDWSPVDPTPFYDLAK